MYIETWVRFKYFNSGRTELPGPKVSVQCLDVIVMSLKSEGQEVKKKKVFSLWIFRVCVRALIACFLWVNEICFINHWLNNVWLFLFFLPILQHAYEETLMTLQEVILTKACNKNLLAAVSWESLHIHWRPVENQALKSLVVQLHGN